MLANTLAVRNVYVVVLDVKPIITENCESTAWCSHSPLIISLDNITYYKCDISKWEEVEAVAKKVIDEVSRNGYGIQLVLLLARSVNRRFL